MCKEWKKWKLKALTPIFTGDISRRGDRTILTGIMGSLRWWFEVLVRGLGGKACDPTAKEVRCPQDLSKNPTDPGHHCVVCELFGCTGWARKFRLMVVDESGQMIQDQIQAGQIFFLRFIPLRPIVPEEWCLLDATLRLIANYGALGGKTVFKPSYEWGIADLGVDDLDDSSGQIKVRHTRRKLQLLKESDVILEVDGTLVTRLLDLENLLSGKPHGEPLKIKVRRGDETREIHAWAGKRHHQDFGLIAVEEWPQDIKCALQQVEAYVQQERWRKNFNDQAFSWASLQNFWCVKERYLERQGRNTSSFNFVIGRPEPKNKSSRGDSWMAGKRPDKKRGIAPESKKIFSFKHPVARTFGFVQSKEEFMNILEKLKVLRDGDGNGRQPETAWKNFNPDREFLKGEQIMEKLFKQEENS